MKKRDKKKRARKKAEALAAKQVRTLPPVKDPPEEWLDEQHAKKSA
jgi:hypothetical protein